MKKMPSGYGMVQTAVMEMEISIIAKAIYALMASYTGSKKYCWPSLVKMSKVLHISKTTVCKKLDELVKAGLIIKSKKSENPWVKSNKYELMYIEDTTESPPDELSEVHAEDVREYQDGERSLNSINNNNNNMNINTPTAVIEKPLPIIIDLCDKINYMPRDKAIFAREMKAAKELLALTEDMVNHYGGDDVIGTIIWMTEQAKKMKAAGHWYLKSKPIKPSTLRYCFDELTTMIVDEKKRREESERFMAENAKMKIREVAK